MDTETSITRWLTGIQRGSRGAEEELWNACFPDLVRFARHRLQLMGISLEESEDVALSSINCLFRMAEEGRIKKLADSNDLWRLLLQITSRKAINRVRYAYCKCRDRRMTRTESNIQKQLEGMPEARVMESEITPDLASMIVDDIQYLHDTLEDPRLQQIALARMQGYTIREISERLGWSRRSVERSLRLIRRIWKSIE